MAAGGNGQWEQRFPEEANCNRCGYVSRSYSVLCTWHCHCHRCDFADQNARRACPYCAEAGMHRAVTPIQETDDRSIEEQWRNVEQNTRVILRTILIVASAWGNIMDIGYTLVRDLVERYAKLRNARIFCICSGCSDADKSNARHSGFVLLPINDMDYDSLEQLKNQVGRVDVLIGLVPMTLERTIHIKDALTEPPGKLILLVHADVRELVNRIEQARADVIYSLGSLIKRSNHSYLPAALQPNHHMYVPQLNPNFSLSVRNTPAAQNFVITFPHIFDEIDDQLFISVGFNTALQVCELFRSMHAAANQKIKLQIFVSQNAVNDTAQWDHYIGQFTQITFLLQIVKDEHEWKDALLKSSVCLCPYIGQDFQHWMYTLIDNNVPYLVTSESPVGALVSEAPGGNSPSPVIQWNNIHQEYVKNWVKALMRVFKSTVSEKTRHALWKKLIIEHFMSRGDALYAAVFDAFTLTVIPDELQYIGLNRILNGYFAMMERSRSHTDLLDTASKSIISKCESGSPITEADLSAESAMIEAYLKLKDAKLLISKYDSGSIVLTVIPTSTEDKSNLQNTEIAEMLEQILIPKGFLDKDTTQPTTTSTGTLGKRIFDLTTQDMPVGHTQISARYDNLYDRGTMDPIPLDHLAHLMSLSSETYGNRSTYSRRT